MKNREIATVFERIADLLEPESAVASSASRRGLPLDPGAFPDLPLPEELLGDEGIVPRRQVAARRRSQEARPVLHHLDGPDNVNQLTRRRRRRVG